MPNSYLEAATFAFSGAVFVITDARVEMFASYSEPNGDKTQQRLVLTLRGGDGRKLAEQLIVSAAASRSLWKVFPRLSAAELPGQRVIVEAVPYRSREHDGMRFQFAPAPAPSRTARAVDVRDRGDRPF